MNVWGKGGMCWMGKDGEDQIRRENVRIKIKKNYKR